jgi:two-component system, NarL family, invasion response regulator UvrY
VEEKLQLLLVDDHAVVRAGIKYILSEAEDLAVAAEAGSVSEALALLKEQSFNLILLDLGMPGQSGMDLLKIVKEKMPDLRVLILSSFGEDQYAMYALQAGADGYLNKESAPDVLIGAIRRVASGKKYISPNLADKFADGFTGTAQQSLEKLSEREFDILRRIAAGQQLVAIAENLHLSATTVSTYRARILEKIGLDSNADLVRYALEKGLVQ